MGLHNDKVPTSILLMGYRLYLGKLFKFVVSVSLPVKCV